MDEVRGKGGIMVRIVPGRGHKNATSIMGIFVTNIRLRREQISDGA